MEDFAGRTAVITGGGGLLGRGMAEAFAHAGMNVVAADLRLEAAEETAALVRAIGTKAIAVQTDVTKPESFEALAERAYGALGAVHLLCLNAGTSAMKPFWELTREDWQRVLDVQFWGVLNGILAFLPRLIEQGGERHIVSTSSMSGIGRADLRQLNAPYVTAKFAVVGMSELMNPALEQHGIGVSVLCPGYTVRDPEAMRDGPFSMPSAAWYKDNLLNARQVGEEVLHGVREKRLYIFPHRAGRTEAEGRHARVMAGFDQAERTSPPLTPPR